MKRDMDLIRAILLEVEESNLTDGSQPVQLTEVPGDVKTVSYQVQLLGEAGLLIVSNDHQNFESEERGEPDFYPVRLTWAGHEFLDAARNDAFWKTATKNVMQKTGGLMFDVLKQALIKLATDAIS
jgi:hypothetical protein